MLELRRLDTRAADFPAAFAALLDRAPQAQPELAARVAAIVEDVRARGDVAVLEYTQRFDRLEASSVAELAVPTEVLRQSWEETAPALRKALQFAAERIRRYAQHQSVHAFEFSDAHGNRLGQKVTPLDRAGLYVPGGKAAYPSSVLMNAIPAKVAGVREVVMCVPAPDGVLNRTVLAAAWLAGVDRVFRIGGAQAVAALAYGTATIPAVDKIVGPGNAYVAAAKRLVFGQVGIDSIAGPSEILIICDGKTPADWIATDLLSQAEHDEDAQAVLLSPDAHFLEAVAGALRTQLERLPRAAIARAALAARGALIQTRSLEEAVELANRMAPEHLELSVDNPHTWAAAVRHAGAIFLGRHTPEAFGDYCAGPNHVLPTSRAARYASPLGVYEFQKRTSLIECTPDGARALAEAAARLADEEGLQAHASSARARN